MKNLNYDNYNTKDKEEKFNNYLNKTIIMSSKKYYKKELNINSKEKLILNNEDYINFLECFDTITSSYFEKIDNKLQLNTALSKLSVIEQAVIFLLFQEDISQEDAAQILNICSKSVSRIKLRAIDKIKKYLKKGDV